MSSSLTACAECGAPVALDAAACASCGRPTVIGTLAVPRRWEAGAVAADAPDASGTSGWTAASPAAGMGVSNGSTPPLSAAATASAALLPPAAPALGGVVLPAGPPIPPTGAYGPGERFAAAAAAEQEPIVVETRPAAPVVRDRLLLERAVAVASAIAGVGMLLPWGPIVIGAPGAGTTLGTIGVLGAWHAIPLLAIVGVAALALAAPRVPDRLRLGVLPLLLAGWLLGLVWPYLLGPLGGGPGPALILAGAIALGGCATATLLLDGRTR